MLDGDEDEAGASTNHVEEVSAPDAKNPEVPTPANSSSETKDAKDASKVEKTVNGEASKSS